MSAAENFCWTGGAVRLVEEITDPVTLRMAWGHAEKDTYTLPFGPWAFDNPEREDDRLAAGPWVWRYGTAHAATGAKYEALATRVHADVADRMGGPIIVSLCSPVRSVYALAAEGFLHEMYVAEKFGLRHESDITAVTMLLRILLGRMEHPDLPDHHELGGEG